jgi:hypothetical protein
MPVAQSGGKGADNLQGFQPQRAQTDDGIPANSPIHIPGRLDQGSANLRLPVLAAAQKAHRSRSDCVLRIAKLAQSPIEIDGRLRDPGGGFSGRIELCGHARSGQKGEQDQHDHARQDHAAGTRFRDDVSNGQPNLVW